VWWCGSAPKPTPNPCSRNQGDGPGEVTPPRSGRSVAAYLAKYVTKSVAEFGVGTRRMSPLAVAELDLTSHVRAILTTLTGLAAHRAYHGMDRWLHTLGFRGHITTKSRLFSTTMGALRAHRAACTTSSTPPQPGARNIMGRGRPVIRSRGNSIGSGCALWASVPRSCPRPSG
jgi:hypothetical protein